jgi:hypothetical protein
VPWLGEFEHEHPPPWISKASGGGSEPPPDVGVFVTGGVDAGGTVVGGTVGFPPASTPPSTPPSGFAGSHLFVVRLHTGVAPEQFELSVH